MALTDNIVSYWKLDSNSNDSVGSNNGTDTSISYASTGKIGNCATFNGSTSLIDLGASSNLNFTTGDYSLSFWIKIASYDSNSEVIYSRGTFNVDGYAVILNFSGSNPGAMFLAHYQSGALQYIGTSNQLPLNTWTLVTVTRTGSTGKIYFNGTECSYYHADSLINPTSTTTHAKLGTGGTNLFNGNLDELGIWSRVLSSGEAVSLYNNGIGFQYNFYSLALTAANATMAFTARTATFGIGFSMTAVTKAMSLSPFSAIFTVFQGWKSATKHSTSWTGNSKSSSSWTNLNKH